jgi:hypothetical protein
MLYNLTFPCCPGYTAKKEDDEEFDVSHMFVVRIKPLSVSRKKCELFITDFIAMTIFHLYGTV